MLKTKTETSNLKHNPRLKLGLCCQITNTIETNILEEHNQQA